jgi:5'(3')-deoxyribonucleotidase
MKKENTPIALFDLDSTLADYDKSMYRQQNLLKGPKEKRYSKESRIHRTSYLEARKKLIQSSPGFWRNLEPLKLGFEVLEITTELGFENHILTKGPQNTNSAWTEKKEWCDEYVPGLDVHISQDKSMVYGKMLCDDWPEYFMAWLKFRPRGLVVCVEQPWNRDIKHPNVIVYDGHNKAEVYDRIVECKKR